MFNKLDFLLAHFSIFEVLFSFFAVDSENIFQSIWDIYIIIFQLMAKKWASSSLASSFLFMHHALLGIFAMERRRSNPSLHTSTCRPGFLPPAAFPHFPSSDRAWPPFADERLYSAHHRWTAAAFCQDFYVFVRAEVIRLSDR